MFYDSIMTNGDTSGKKFVDTFMYLLLWISLDICDYDWSGGGVTFGQTKTPLYLTGLTVSGAESTRFELVHDY